VADSALARRVSLDVAGLILVTSLAFAPVLSNDFVNWDDPTVLLQNDHLGGPQTVRWAFTATVIGHYQPLAWIVWSWARALFGLRPSAFHALSLIGHLLNAVLVYVVAWRLASIAELDRRRRRIAALTASIAFAVHPVRAEAVAWASAFPYVLSLAALLIAFLAYLNAHDRGRGTRSVAWLTLSLVSYAAALLARATAVGLPFVLLVVDLYPLRRAIRRNVLLEKVPFILVAAAAVFAESRSRDVATLGDVGAGARLTMAASAPFRYFGRTVLPIGLSPLDPLAISPAIAWVPLGLALAGFAALAALVWRTRRRWPALAVAAAAYLLLLAPVAGLAPTGLQATADRYVYVPGVVIAVMIGIVGARLCVNRRRSLVFSVAGVALTIALAALSWRQTTWWRDSIALWTRAVDLDPLNDIATYNLAVALAEAGRDDDAIARYHQTLQLVPDQTLAREHLVMLQAKQAERAGDQSAAAGRVADASAQYERALALDPRRPHARAGHGIALLRRGQFDEAAAELRAALDAGIDDPEVPNSLAFALGRTGRPAEAVAVLERALARHPDDINLVHNLARLLATAQDVRVRNGAAALRLAQEVRDRTGGRDPRAIDTLAAAYAAVGRFEEARATAMQAAARAKELGNVDLADEIAAHARSYGR
jgi:Flp pilus assembly protein TadD